LGYKTNQWEAWRQVNPSLEGMASCKVFATRSSLVASNRAQFKAVNSHFKWHPLCITSVVTFGF
jgi:hypothetical protein